MNYVLLNEKREVLEVSSQIIVNSNPHYEVAQINVFMEGDEVNFYIVVRNIEDGVVTEYSAVKQTPFISSILEENKMLKNSLADLWEVVLIGGTK